MNIALWIVQFLLAAFFGMAGFGHAIRYEQTAATIPWVAATPKLLVVFIGTCEMLGALGVLLPWLTGRSRQLTPLAAAGLALIMLLAVPFHLVRNEAFALVFLVPVAAMAVFVAWGRWRMLKDS